MQPRIWEAEAGVPRLPSVQSLLKSAWNQEGKVGVHEPVARRLSLSQGWGPQTPGHPDVTGSPGIGNECTQTSGHPLLLEVPEEQRTRMSTG